jgi:hypothetical protein
MGTRVLEALTNNKLVAGAVLLALTLGISGMRSDAASEVRLQAVEEKVKTIDVLKEFQTRYEEREKNRDTQISRMERKLDKLLEK